MTLSCFVVCIAPGIAEAPCLEAGLANDVASQAWLAA